MKAAKDSRLKKSDVSEARKRSKEQQEKERQEKSPQTPRQEKPEQRASRKGASKRRCPCECDQAETQKKRIITWADQRKRSVPNMKDREALDSYSDEQALKNFATFFGQSLAVAGEVANTFVAAHETVSGSKRVIADLKAQLSEASRNYKALEVANEELKEKLADFEAHYVHKEDFLSSKEFVKTKEFNEACGAMASIYFDHGFNGCLAQIRDGGFSAEQYPFGFLDSDKAFEEVPEDGEEEEESLMMMMMVKSEQGS